MKRRMTSFCVVASVAICLPVTGALAHHSFATHYDASRSTQLRGTVADFDFRSPHSFLFVDVRNDTGESTRWEVELHSVPVLTRMGFSAGTFRPGDQVTVIAWPNRRADNPLVFGIGVITADGTALGEFPPIGDVRSEFLSASGVARVQGRWQVPRPGEPSTLASPMPLTAAGLAAVAAYDPQQSPANFCEPYNIPAAFHTPYLFDIRINEREAIIYHEAYGVTRRAPFGTEAVRAERTGQFGMARASIDGDELVVESSDFPASAWGLATAVDENGVGADIPSSDRKSIVERFSVSEDGLTLTVRYEVTDPVFLSAPFASAARLDRVDDDASMYDFRCELDSAARFSRDP